MGLPSSKHRTRFAKLMCFVFTLFLSVQVNSQSPVDSMLGRIDPERFAASIGKKAEKLSEKIIAKSIKSLNKLKRQEEKIYRKLLSTKDSAQAKASLAEINAKYASLKEEIRSPEAIRKAKQYIPKLDTVTTALKFLDQNNVGGKIKDALGKTQSLQGKFANAEAIQQFIRERKQQLKQQLQNLGMLKQLKKFNKEAYYYSEQIKEYKELLKDSKKAERKALELLSKTKVFKDFMRKNSQLASLFRIPGEPMNAASLAGLQTRSQVNNLIQQQIAAGGPNARQQFSQNLQQAQTQLTQLKDKILKAGGTSSEDDLPGFKPNNQKTKSFLQRLEYGTNIQTQKATSFFPVTSDIGLSVGYKLNNKGIIGIGASYKIGLGRGWNNIRLSHEGLGLRSFIDWKIKGSFFVSGGYEQNYRAAFNSISQLQNESAWQQSGLIGISKVMSVKTKFFKKTKLQLLWDLLSYQQIPRTQSLIFRVSYNFK